MDLFEHAHKDKIDKEQPLAARMRPRTLDEYMGQDHILAPGRLLRRAIQADQISSLIFYGPPGTGKTTLASVIANTTRSHFVVLNAVLSGIKDIRFVTEEAQTRKLQYGRRTILFVDEVHRWNKSQQDALLPWVENGTVILIGATTENPYFTVNRALVSRSRIFQLTPLENKHLFQVAEQALQDEERGYGNLHIEFKEDSLDHLVQVANGDARALLNALELAIETTTPDSDGTLNITMQVAEESIQKRAVLYDKEGDCHFDTISAFIKSLRGSDPDATMYWMAKMVYAGEDPRFIFRRMIIFASEDIGLADPNALPHTIAAAEAFDRVGMPEGRFHLAQSALYLATAPKSNTTFCFFDALISVKEESKDEVPNHLKDASRDKKGFGHGEGYMYPHAYRDHWVAQQYLPDSLQGKVFYQPGTLGYEADIADQVYRRREEQLAGALDNNSLAANNDGLTYSPEDRATDRWLSRAVSSSGQRLGEIRDRLFELLSPPRHALILDLNGGDALFTWEAVRKAPEGGIWSLVPNNDIGQALLEQSERLPYLRRPVPVTGDINAITELTKAEDLHFDYILGRNQLGKKGGKDFIISLSPITNHIGLADIIPSRNQRIYKLIPDNSLDSELLEKIKDAEESLYSDNKEQQNWDKDDVAQWCKEAGFETVINETVVQEKQMLFTQTLFQRWFGDSREGKTTYKEHLLNKLSEAEVQQVENVFNNLTGQPITWQSTILITVAGKQ